MRFTRLRAMPAHKRLRLRAYVYTGGTVVIGNGLLVGVDWWRALIVVPGVFIAGTVVERILLDAVAAEATAYRWRCSTCGVGFGSDNPAVTANLAAAHAAAHH